MINSIASAPVRPARAEDLAKAAANLQARQASIPPAVSLVGTIGGAVALYDTGKAAIGHGAAGTALQVIGCVGEGIGIYKGIVSLRASVDAKTVNDALKDANGGKDLDPNDAARLAADLTSRAHTDGFVTAGSSLAMGAAIVLGSAPLAIVALLSKVGEIGYGVASTVATLKEVQAVLKNAPQPAPAPPPANP